MTGDSLNRWLTFSANVGVVIGLILLVAEVEGGALTDIGAQLAVAAGKVAGAGDEIAVAVMSDDPTAAAASAACVNTT